MKSILLSIALLSTSAYAQFDHQLFRAIPDQGPVSGGTEVTIEGEFNFSGLGDPCVGPDVWVGGQPAGRGTIIDNESKLIFETPPYTAGTFDIVVNICGAKATLKNAFTYGDRWERVLLPIYLSHDVAGAQGSIWRTELTASASLGTVTGDPQIVTGLPIGSDHHVPGRMIYLGGRAADKGGAVLNLRVRDVSRAAESLGTELPAVREDNAFGPYESIVLPNVPVGSRYRAKLRLYRIDMGEARDLRVSVSHSDMLLFSQELTLSSEPMTTTGFLLYPGYAELDIDRVPNIESFDRVEVTIQTPPAGLYWAFVAVTNNDTQQITTVTPQ